MFLRTCFRTCFTVPTKKSSPKFKTKLLTAWENGSERKNEINFDHRINFDVFQNSWGVTGLFSQYFAIATVLAQTMWCVALAALCGAIVGIATCWAVAPRRRRGAGVGRRVVRGCLSVGLSRCCPSFFCFMFLGRFVGRYVHYIHMHV